MVSNRFSCNNTYAGFAYDIIFIEFYYLYNKMAIHRCKTKQTCGETQEQLLQLLSQLPASHFAVTDIP